MAFISLKCPSCGADIELDESREFGFCSYCGTKIVQEKQVVELKGEVKVEGVSTADKLLERAYILVEDMGYFEAEGYFNRVLELDPKCAKAYWGKMLCEYRIPSAETAEAAGIDITKSNNYSRAIMYATGKQKDKYIEHGEKAAGTYGANEKKAADEQKKANVIGKVFKIFFAIAPIVNFIIGLESVEKETISAYSFVIFTISVLWFISYFTIKKSQEKIKTNKLFCTLRLVWGIFGGLIIVCSCFLPFGENVPADETKDSAVATSIVSTTEPTTEAAIDISAIKLIEAYNNNGAAFEKNYVDKILVVSGIIDDVRTTSGEKIVISISDGESWSNVDCYLESSETEKALTLKTGNRITVKGECEGESLGDPYLYRCVIVE